MHLVVDLAHGTADALKRRACVVADLILLQDAPPDLGGQRSHRFQLLEQRIQAVLGLVTGLVPSIRFDASCGFQQFADAEQFAASKGGAHLQALQRVSYRIASAKRRPALLDDPRKCGGGFLLGRLNV